jgi:hypothetical protein
VKPSEISDEQEVTMCSRRTLALSAVLSLLLASNAWSQSTDQQVRSQSGRLSTGLAVPPYRFISAQNPSSAERQQWAQELARANDRLRKSTWFMIGGAGIIGLGAMLQAREKETGLTYITDVGLGTVSLAYLVGGGSIAWGVIERTRAQKHIADLEAEGRQKGFTVSIRPEEMRLAYVVTF